MTASIPLLLALLGPASAQASEPAAATSPVAAPVAEVTRVFFSPMTVGSGAGQDVVSLFEERILVSARRHTAFAVLGGGDVKALVDIDASLQATGCTSSVDCVAEIAGALDAPQILTGQLGRVGNTWVLTLTRAERATLDVKARVVREAQGETPEALLSAVDGAVAEVFGVAAAAGPNPLVVGGAISAGVGVAAFAVASGATLASWGTFQDAEAVLNDADRSNDEKARTREQAAARGGLLNLAATASWVVGGVLVVGGAAAAFAGWSNE